MLGEEEEGVGVVSKGAGVGVGLPMEATLLIDGLQQALTKLQIQALEERRNYLDLASKNNHLQLEVEGLGRKLAAALLLGKVEEAAVEHFLARNPAAPHLTDQLIKVTQQLKHCGGGKGGGGGGGGFLDGETLRAQLRLLREELRGVREAAAVERFGLNASLHLTLKERAALTQHYQHAVEEQKAKVEELGLLLHTATQETLAVKKKLLVMEERAAKGPRPQDDHPHHKAEGEATPTTKRATSKSTRLLMENLSRAQIALLEKDAALKELQLKELAATRAAARANEQLQATKRHCTAAISKLRGKQEVVEGRFERLEERRRLDNAGFRADVKALRTLCAAIQKKLELFMARKENVNSNVNANVDVNPHAKENTETDTTATAVKKRGVAKKTKEGGAVLKPLNPKAGRVLNREEEPRPQQPIIKTLEEEREKDRVVYGLLSALLTSANHKVEALEAAVHANQ